MPRRAVRRDLGVVLDLIVEVRHLCGHMRMVGFSEIGRLRSAVLRQTVRVDSHEIVRCSGNPIVVGQAVQPVLLGVPRRAVRRDLGVVLDLIVKVRHLRDDVRVRSGREIGCLRSAVLRQAACIEGHKVVRGSGDAGMVGGRIQAVLSGMTRGSVCRDIRMVAHFRIEVGYIDGNMRVIRVRLLGEFIRDLACAPQVGEARALVIDLAMLLFVIDMRSDFLGRRVISTVVERLGRVHKPIVVRVVHGLEHIASSSSAAVLAFHGCIDLYPRLAGNGMETPPFVE